MEREKECPKEKVPVSLFHVILPYFLTRQLPFAFYREYTTNLEIQLMTMTYGHVWTMTKEANEKPVISGDEVTCIALTSAVM